MNFTSDYPFRHLVRDDLITREEMTAINAEWPVGGWKSKSGKTSIKMHTLDLPPTAAKVVKRLTSAQFRQYLSEILGIPNLLPDPEKFGAGLHCIPPGGFLKMHVDFNQHPSGLWRRANLLVYLNENWNPEWGGELILSKNGKSTAVFPHGMVALAFATTEDSWHGHPEPLRCPPDVQRRSLAIYYYTKEPPENAAEPHTTIYRM